MMVCLVSPIRLGQAIGFDTRQALRMTVAASYPSLSVRIRSSLALLERVIFLWIKPTSFAVGWKARPMRRARRYNEELCDMKPCPNCAQAIQDVAIKCRYCKSWLVPFPAEEPTNAMLPQPLRTISGMAIASLVLGILWIYWLGSILALIFGYVARREIKRDPEHIDGQGLALAGIILGWIGIGTLTLTLIIIAFMALSEREEKKRNQRPVSEHALVILRPRNPATDKGSFVAQCPS